MGLDQETCYRAVASRDPRFDGRFFTGVTTTGIYCRPICPAPTPRRRNCQFYACAAAAAAAGFRPCLRCRPESAPGTPAWQGTSATVSRALRLIGEGAGVDRTVGELAEHLGLGERQLRRLFRRHLGASPAAVAQTRRLHFAKQLIDQTRLPMAEVALAAGFGSLRRFNAVVRRAYRRTPTDLRRSAELRDPAVADAMLELHLPFRAPYDWEGVLTFLQPRAIPGVECVRTEAYRRTIEFGDANGVIEIAPELARRSLRLRVPVAFSSYLVRIVGRVRRLFDLSADPGEIAARLGRDPRLAASVRAHPGRRIPGAWDPFELAVRAILGQQVTVRGASTLAARLVQEYGQLVSGADPPGPVHLFPRPERLARAQLSRIGLPKARAGAIRALARAVADGSLILDDPARVEEAKRALSRLPGVGPWTVGYIAMRAFGEPDAWPANDVGLRHALSEEGQLLSEPALTKRAEVWRPWRAYAAMHLWLEDPGARAGGEYGKRVDGKPNRKTTNRVLPGRPGGDTIR